MRALAALLFASFLLALAACPFEGECRSEEDCPDTTGCAVSGLADPDPNDEEVPVSVSETQTFSFLCMGFSNAALQRDVIVPVLIESFTADHATVTSGGGTTLRYRVDEAVSACDVLGAPVDVAAGAHAVENLMKTPAFVLRCERPDGLFAKSDPVTVEVA